MRRELADSDKRRSLPPAQHAGRLDLLLTDPDAAIRYEVEIQMGATPNPTSSARSTVGR